MSFFLKRFVCAIVVATGVVCLPAAAQQRRPNPGAQTFLHEWPVSGAWEAALVRLAPDRNVGCIIITGYHNLQSGETYLWGLRRREKQTAVEIIDSNSAAVEGLAIKVVVDGAIIGDFPVTARHANNRFSAIRSDLSAKDAIAIQNLLSVGGNIAFSTDNATYSASLAGAQKAMQNFYACTVEANQINSAQTQ